MRTFAISDIHGCQLTFDALLNKIGLNKEDQLYLLGDYIDRGPRSKQVLDQITNLKNEGYHLRCLRGNHEQMMLDAQHDLMRERNWRRNGGNAALDSFNAIDLDEIPGRYFQQLEDCFHCLTTDDYVFVHAGLNFEAENPMDDKKAMIWIRRWEDKADKKWLNGRIIIHGHTPTRKKAIKKRFKRLDEIPVLPIDNGCAYSKDGFGNLCAVDLTNRELYFKKRVD